MLEFPSVKVAYLVNRYPSVSHTFITREIRALEQRGIDVTRFSIRPGINDDKTHVLLRRPWRSLGWISPRRFVAALVTAIRIGRRSRRGVAIHLAYLVEAMLLVVEMRRRDITHLHAHFGTNPAAVAALAERLGGPPFSVTVHGYEEFEPGIRETLGIKCERARFVAAVCDSRARELRGLVTHDRVITVRCGLDEVFSRAPRVALPERLRLVTVGRLVPEKDHATLFAALERIDLDWELDVIGAGEPPRAVSSRITFLGARSGPEIVERILAARLFVLPSRRESLPVALIEAMCLARPVVATDVGGVSELVVPGEHGWLVPPENVDALEAALREAFATPTARLTAMGDAASKRARERHAIDEEIIKLLDRFSSTAPARAGGRDTGAVIRERIAGHPRPSRA